MRPGTARRLTAAVLALGGAVMVVAALRPAAAEVRRPDARQSEARPSDARQPEARQPEAWRPDVRRPEMWRPDARPPGTAVPAPSRVRPERPSRPARPARTAWPRSAPVHLSIPAIGVETALTAVGRRPDGTVEVPPLSDDAPAAWYRPLASPGETGSAVILGHVDSAGDGPAVFFGLRELLPGDAIAVRRADGEVVRFAVSRVVTVPKDEFPTNAVYGPADRPVLRLVTCGGHFDRERHRYRGNVIVFGELWHP
uniref:class F sortase n=1 Tax=Paractinoplanes polyasparticus TaxID=2856853 RepID=UPI002107B364|nr:class F sortase [Actinoplanes polyasparticus]